MKAQDSLGYNQTITDHYENRPTRAIVNLRALTDNFRSIQAYTSNLPILAILKANAYGNGLTNCALHLQSIGCKNFGVAFLEEALALRAAGISGSILVLGGLSGRQVRDFLLSDIEITASSITKLELVETEAKALGVKAKVQLKIDTGMERIGVHYYSAQSLLEYAITCKHLELTGIFSHFADSENSDLSLTKLQLERFLEVTDFFNKRSLPSPTKHIANSGAILAMTESHLDMVRPGALLYGVCPAPHLLGKIKITPTLTLRSEVVYFKVIQEGAKVSYGHKWTANRQTRLVTIPLGYGDGYHRALSNLSSVLIRGNRYPIVGSICMDQFMVNIGPEGIAYNGDEVILIGEQNGERITVEELAELAKTDSREILVSINQRVPRVYHENQHK